MSDSHPLSTSTHKSLVEGVGERLQFEQATTRTQKAAPSIGQLPHSSRRRKGQHSRSLFLQVTNSA